MTTRVIRVVLDGSGVRTGAAGVKTQLDGVQGKAKGVTSQFKNMAKAAAGFAAVLGVREIIRLTNTYQTLQNALRVVTDSQEELNVAADRLFDVVGEAGSSNCLIKIGRATLAVSELRHASRCVSS